MPAISTLPSTASILAVDDTFENLEVLVDMLQGQGFQVRAFTRAAAALRSALRQPPDLVLMDVSMPEINGYEACAHFKASEPLKDIPILFVSALNEEADKVRGFAAGGVDYLTKPLFAEELIARVRTHLELSQLRCHLQRQHQNLEERVAELAQETVDSQIATILAVTRLAEERDGDTGVHLLRIQSITRALAGFARQEGRYRDRLSEDDVEHIARGSALHDAGKIAIPDSILGKQGRLAAEEWEVMKQHTLLGSSALEPILRRYPNNPFLKFSLCIARSHHEHWDGTGYPDGLAGQAIPLAARILSLADAYDALRSKRSYKEQKKHEEACKVLEEGKGRHFDPDLVDIFMLHHQEIEAAYASAEAKIE